MKYKIVCKSCNTEIENFGEWFKAGQKCPSCGSEKADVRYLSGLSALAGLLSNKDNIKPNSMWHYFDYLPVERKENIISSGEGMRRIDRLYFLEEMARDKGVNCKVFGHRHDNNPSTGTFKDLAGSVVASVLKENGIKNYIVSSTGNIGVAYSRYMAAADINLFAFIPCDSSKSQIAEISCFGQKVFWVRGDYTKAKKIAREFSQNHNIMLSQGSFDPMRIEAKKTMAYDWALMMDEFPTVYIQALSGGTGPLGVEKGIKEMIETGIIPESPRFVMVQSDRCSPMADAWAKAKNDGFKDDWHNKFPVYDNPETEIMTLATGNPVAYPEVSELVWRSGGEILSFPENYVKDVAKIVAYETAIRMGPAAATAVGGFFSALKNNTIKEGDVVLIAIGEGMRRSPEFMQQLAYTCSSVSDVDECELINRKAYKDMLWDRIRSLI